MNLILIQQVGATLTLILGLFAIVSPASVERFVSIKASGKLGVSEIRATYGGFFLGIAIFALVSNDRSAYFALGFGWLMAAIVRFFTIVFGSYSVKNMAGVVFELTIALLCLCSFIVPLV